MSALAETLQLAEALQMRLQLHLRETRAPQPPAPPHAASERRAPSTPGADPVAAPRPPVRPRVVVAVVSLVMVLSGAAWLMLELGRHPVDSVRIAAGFRHLDRGELEAVVEPHLGRSFFAVDVAAVRTAARALPWVREASVRRVWPGAIHIAIVERDPAFRWGEASLLEYDATLFTPSRREGFDHLPLLVGPPGTEAEVRNAFADRQTLLAAAGLELAELHLSPRGAWRAVLGNGVTLVLGREGGEAGVRRFVRAFPAVLAERIGQVVTVDLRYANGFSVEWKPAPAPGDQQ